MTLKIKKTTVISNGPLALIFHLLFFFGGSSLEYRPTKPIKKRTINFNFLMRYQWNILPLFRNNWTICIVFTIHILHFDCFW